MSELNDLSQLQRFSVDITEKVALLKINRPDKANALDLRGWQELANAIRLLDNTPEVRVIILFGEGKHFCSGIDLSVLMNLNQKVQNECEGRKGELLRKFLLELQGHISSVEQCSKPVIAAIHGGCIGGGIDLAAACDLRYCVDSAVFSIKEIDIGLVADLGTLQRLPKFMNLSYVAELAFTGKDISGHEAEKIGLVTRSFTTLEAMLAQVQELAQTIAAKSPLVVRGIKQMLLYARDNSVSNSLNQMATWNAAMLLSNDLKEALDARSQKREPRFQD